MRVPSTLALLGDALDVRFVAGERKHTLPLRSFLLCSDTSKSVLWLLPKPKGRRRRVELKGHAAARDVRRLWSAFEADEAFIVPWSDGVTRKLGTVASIGYRSDKWTGKATDYEHDFRSEPVIEKSGRIYRIRGGRVRVTAAGITG